MVTCGLTHTGGPETTDGQELGLHGRVSNLKAELESIIQPDLRNGKLDMSITGIIRESKIFGPNLELRRTISSRIGEAFVRVDDTVTNVGNSPAPLMILYHCNFGWPLVDEGTDIIWRGKCVSRGLDMDNEIFNSKFNYKKCQPPMDSHRGPGESCGFIDVKADSKGICRAGLVNKKMSLALVMEYEKSQLPALCNWQHWGCGEYVCALEPGTNPPIGRAKARQQKKLIMLKPGQSKDFQLKISILTDKGEINRFCKTVG